MLKGNDCWVLCCSYGRVGEQKSKKALVTSDDGGNTASNEIVYSNIDQVFKLQPAEKKVNFELKKEEEKRGSRKKGEGEDSDSEESEEQENEFSSGKRVTYLYFAPKVLHPVTRALVMVLTVVLIGASVVVCWSSLRVGFHPSHLANRKSNTFQFKVADWTYFRDYTDALFVEILLELRTEPFNGNYFKLRDSVLNVVSKIEQIDDHIWGSQLNQVPIRQIDSKKDLTNQTTIYQGVAYVADKTSDSAMRPRILHANSRNEKLVTMMKFQIRDVSELSDGAELSRRLMGLQKAMEQEPGTKFYITDYAQLLRVFDQIINMPSQFIYFTLITVASTVVTSLAMIPNPICIFWMAFASMCIIAGTLAGMALTGVGLDPISLIYILMAIGGTADYICHCIYLFTVIELDESKKKLTDSEKRYEKARILISELIAEAGPAATGTTLSIIVLSTSHNYVLESFFKVFIIAVAVGITFMLIVLPVVLCQFGPVSKTCCGGDENHGGGGGEKATKNPLAADLYYYEQVPVVRKHVVVNTTGGRGVIDRETFEHGDLTKLRLLRRFLSDVKRQNKRKVLIDVEQGVDVDVVVDDDDEGMNDRRQRQAYQDEMRRPGGRRRQRQEPVSRGGENVEQVAAAQQKMAVTTPTIYEYVATRRRRRRR